jgi:hypothetical protein
MFDSIYLDISFYLMIGVWYGFLTSTQSALWLTLVFLIPSFAIRIMPFFQFGSPAMYETLGTIEVASVLILFGIWSAWIVRYAVRWRFPRIFAE